jgi:hypothetical protein
VNGFEYLRSANRYFEPRTPRAALKAVEAGLLPKEAYIYKATSVKPLNEEPVDIPEIERILAREENDLATNLLVASILKELLEHKDPEIALFGAESIDTIENRYNSRIERYKQSLGTGDDASALRGIGRQFFEIAGLNGERPAIKKFYLVEAYSYMQRLFREGPFDRTDLELTVEILLALRCPDRARFILEHLRGDARDEPAILMLRARVEFAGRRFDRLAELLGRVRKSGMWLSAEQQELVRLWTEAVNA